MSCAVARCAAPQPAVVQRCRGAARGRAAAPARLVRATAGATGNSLAGAANGAAKPHLEVTDVGASTNIRWHETMVVREDKELLLGQRGCVLWFTGESAGAAQTGSWLL